MAASSLQVQQPVSQSSSSLLELESSWMSVSLRLGEAAAAGGAAGATGAGAGAKGVEMGAGAADVDAKGVGASSDSIEAARVLGACGRGRAELLMALRM